MSEYWLEIGVFEGRWSVSAKFSRSKGHLPRTIFALIDKPVNALQLVADSIHTKKLKQTLFKWCAILDGKRLFCIFEPLWGLGATYDIHLRRSPVVKRHLVHFGLKILYMARPSRAIVNAYKHLPTDCAKSSLCHTDSSAKNQFLSFSLSLSHLVIWISKFPHYWYVAKSFPSLRSRPLKSSWGSGERCAEPQPKSILVVHFSL